MKAEVAKAGVEIMVFFENESEAIFSLFLYL